MLLERDAFEQLHHEVDSTIVERADVEHVDDVWMAQPGDQPRFVEQPRIRAGCMRFAALHLDRGEPVELRVACFVDRAESTAPEHRPGQRVGTDREDRYE